MNRELHEAIGKVTIAYSSLDFMIASFAGRLVSQDQRVGQSLFGPMQMSRKIETLKTLLELLPSVDCDDSQAALASLKQWDIAPVFKPQVAELHGLLNRAKAAGDTRNNIMHALTWFPDSRQQGDPVPTILRVRGSRLVEQAMPVSRVDDLANEIGDIVQALGQFMLRHFRDNEMPWEPQLGRGSLWESTVKSALSLYLRGVRPESQA
jgi:hypothetical protein